MWDWTVRKCRRLMRVFALALISSSSSLDIGNFGLWIESHIAIEWG